MRKICMWFAVVGVLFVSTLSEARSLPDFTELVEKTSPAVVKINTVAKRKSKRLFDERQLPQGSLPDIFRELLEPQQRDVASMGSGFLISADGYILTNHHVVGEADEIVVRLVDRREFNAVLVGTDERSDLALLKIDADKLPFLKFAKPDTLKVGEWVLAIGSPFGLDFSASAGIVSAIGRSIPTEKNENYVPFIQTDVAINPGNSGGPLFNLNGEVVGINSQIFTRSGGSIGLSFAIPASVATSVVSQIKEKGHVDRGWLGVVIQEVDKDLAESFGLEKPAGALVAQMEPGGPAAQSGLEVGDVIVEFDGIAIESSGDLPHVVGRTMPGEKVSAVVIRKGKRKELRVTVGTLGKGTAEVAMTEGPDGGRLGLSVAPAAGTDGVLVDQVFPGGPVAKAGLRNGDIITQLGYDAVENVDDFWRLVEALPEKKPVPIRFLRRGQAIFKTLIIE